jgi:hypothetical protein
MRFTCFLYFLFYCHLVHALPLQLFHAAIHALSHGLSKVNNVHNTGTHPIISQTTAKLHGNTTISADSSKKDNTCPKTLIIIKRGGTMTENEAKSAITAACPNFNVQELGTGRIVYHKKVIYHTKHKDLKVIGRHGVQFGDCPVSLNPNYIAKMRQPRFCWI